jgi:hypothetical protein
MYDYPLSAAVIQADYGSKIIDGGGIPIGQEAVPYNPAAGVLQVFIDSPTNHATLH